MSNLTRYDNLLSKKSKEPIGGDDAKKELLGLETISETIQETKKETKSLRSEVASELTPLFVERIPAEKVRKRQTYFMDNEEIKMIERMAKKLNRKKFEVVASAVRMMYSEFEQKQGKKRAN